MSGMAGIDYGIILVYLLSMAGLGIYLQQKKSSSVESYFLGERGLPWWLLGISGMSSNLDCTGTMIIVALLFSLGVSGFFVEIRGGVVLVLPFLMIFMGKWYRRAQVMTLAEWMHFRFGKGKGSDLARIINAIGSILLTTALVTYFCKGTGKFITEFLQIPAFLGLPPDFWAALLLIGLAMIYTVAVGFRGVVYADCIRSVITFVAILVACYLCMTRYELPERFRISVPVNEAALVQQEAAGTMNSWSDKYKVEQVGGKHFVVWETTRAAWSSVLPPKKFDFPAFSDYAMFNLILIAIAFYVIRTTLEGFAGATGHMAQRYFAAKSDREAGLLSMLWIILLAFRWPFVAAVAVMGIHLSTLQGISDPEKVLPMVVARLFPVGLKGLLVAGLMAAAMSTFDATVNSGAAYWVNDIYRAYLNPKANNRQLMLHSRLGSVMIVAAGVTFSLVIKNINEIWGLFTMGITAGMFVPLLVRWFWWRLNGWGFSIGTAVGILAALLQKSLLPAGLPEFIPFLIVCSTSLVALIVATLLTSPVEESVLDHFYRKTRPLGFWGSIRKGIPPEIIRKINGENRRDMFSTVFAVGWQLFLFLMLMSLVLKRWDEFSWLFGAFALCSVVLYFSWYRHLDEEVVLPPAGEDTLLKEQSVCSVSESPALMQ
jgi:Na+/proline symporter